MARDNIYIGARYVPIFDGEYSTSKEYEPLTIVQYLGNSYTSKTYVPVGVNPTNETYWVLTGNFNAQISQLQETVDGFNTRISTTEGLAENASEKVEKITYKSFRLSNDGGRRVYVSVNGSDETGDGTDERPWRTINKAFFESENKENDVRIYLEGAGDYDWSAISVMSSMAIHIAPNPNTYTGNKEDYRVKIFRNQTIYDSHTNLQNLTVYCNDAEPAPYFEGGVVNLYNVKWLTNAALTFYGCNVWTEDIVCSRLFADRSNLQLLGDRITFTGSIVGERPCTFRGCNAYAECEFYHTGTEAGWSGNHGFLTLLGGVCALQLGTKRFVLEGGNKFPYGIYCVAGVVLSNPFIIESAASASNNGNTFPRAILCTKQNGAIFED